MRLVGWIGWSVGRWVGGSVTGVDLPFVSRRRRVSFGIELSHLGHRPRGASGETTTTEPEKGEEEREEERSERMKSIRRDLRRWFRKTGTPVRDA